MTERDLISLLPDLEDAHDKIAALCRLSNSRGQASGSSTSPYDGPSDLLQVGLVLPLHSCTVHIRMHVQISTCVGF